MAYDVLQIAKVCHEANRAYCESIGDLSQPSWLDAPDWQRDTIIEGVTFHLDNETSPEDSHVNWMTHKANEGWTFGLVKDPEKKTHPCMVPFDKLPPTQQMKDRIFHAIVNAFKNSE